MEEKEICELLDCFLDDGCVEVCEFVNFDIVVVLVCVFVVLKFWWLFLCWFRGNVSILFLIYFEVVFFDILVDKDFFGVLFVDFFILEFVDEIFVLFFVMGFDYILLIN